MFLFNLKGPEFLAVYLLLLVTGLILAWWLAQRWRTPWDDGGPASADLEPYEVAFLAGGAPRAAWAMLANLLQRGVILENTFKSGFTVQPDVNLPDHLERRAYDVVAASPPEQVRERLKDVVDVFEERLQALGLLMSEEAQSAYRRCVWAVMGVVLLIGGIKVCVGLSRERPVFFLVMLLIGTLVLAANVAKAPLRTLRGDKVLKHFERRNAALRTSAMAAGSLAVSPLSGDSIVYAVGLFGVSAAALDPTLTALGVYTGARPAPVSADSSGGSSCSSGGCGGGGCGGGCGGCGS